MKNNHSINRRIINVLIGIMLITGSLIAQPGQNRQGPPKLPDSDQIVKMVDKLSETLSLSEEQKSKISEMYFTHFDEVKQVMKQNKGNREDHHQAMEALRKKFTEQVKSELTEEQQIQYNEFSKKHQPQKRQRR